VLLASSCAIAKFGWRVFGGKHGDDGIQVHQAYKGFNAAGRIGYYEFHTLAQSSFTEALARDITYSGKIASPSDARFAGKIARSLPATSEAWSAL
jgi:hypothetical protein